MLHWFLNIFSWWWDITVLGIVQNTGSDSCSGDCKTWRTFSAREWIFMFVYFIIIARLIFINQFRQEKTHLHIAIWISLYQLCSDFFFKYLLCLISLVFAQEFWNIGDAMQIYCKKMRIWFSQEILWILLYSKEKKKKEVLKNFSKCLIPHYSSDWVCL